jgi:hypothetical protein
MGAINPYKSIKHGLVYYGFTMFYPHYITPGAPGSDRMVFSPRSQTSQVGAWEHPKKKCHDFNGNITTKYGQKYVTVPPF